MAFIATAAGRAGRINADLLALSVIGFAFVNVCHMQQSRINHGDDQGQTTNRKYCSRSFRRREVEVLWDYKHLTHFEKISQRYMIGL